MTEIQRYDFHSGQGEPFMREVPNGKWVLAEDVQQLEQRIELLFRLFYEEDTLNGDMTFADWRNSIENQLKAHAALKESE